MYHDRRKNNRQAVGALVFVIFLLLGSFAIVVGTLVEQNHQLRQQGVRIESIARNAETAAEGAQRATEEAQPCNPGDPPGKPACQRAARTESVITRAIDLVRQALAIGLELHDLNTHRQHEDIRRRMGEPGPPVERTPITTAAVAAVPTTSPPAVLPPPAPTTTTTTVARSVPLPSLIPTLPPPPPEPEAPTCRLRGKSGKCR